ncbi:MarR family winged helix-turn-helix transcriptional regulator [Pengzhenrongella sicca]|uniref:Winged helix-turn-helix transcriptional regulator n=1 Tax=Pengzhenrongella sicca TaxID=2819238 RepID=A0A8A4ZGQ5_9MICO|nr:MarR family winged helix-turn-helix transcriptional regulator [Pengzhenrongella sicca]QTE30133.1 winged helix-turn-helix transcriptional regulator [Pengzhenrongella sicca]
MTERWQEGRPGERDGEALGDATEALERSRLRAPEVSWALREVNRAAADVDHELAGRLDLRALDYTAMGHLMGAPATLGPAELSARLGISTGSGTELVDRLERAGHLRRRRNDRDRRRVGLEPTESAVADILGELGPLFAALDALAEDFSPEEQEVIARYLRSAAQRMRAFGAAGGSTAPQRGDRL